MNDGPALAHDEDGYDGPADLLAGDGDEARAIAVAVTLRGVFQPIDGHYHWYGRLAKNHSRNDDIEHVARSGAPMVLQTPHGEAEGRLSDLDPWGRHRISGTGKPPFPTIAVGDLD